MFKVFCIKNSDGTTENKSYTVLKEYYKNGELFYVIEEDDNGNCSEFNAGKFIRI